MAAKKGAEPGKHGAAGSTVICKREKGKCIAKMAIRVMESRRSGVSLAPGAKNGEVGLKRGEGLPKRLQSLAKQVRKFPKRVHGFPKWLRRLREKGSKGRGMCFGAGI
jgi:hypothetical protein